MALLTRNDKSYIFGSNCVFIYFLTNAYSPLFRGHIQVRGSKIKLYFPQADFFEKISAVNSEKGAVKITSMKCHSVKQRPKM